MIKFLESNAIKVFPCSNRDPESDTTSRLMTEYNISSLINRFVDQKSFVVNANIPSEIANARQFEFSLDFNIYGYYFRIEEVKNLVTASDFTEAGTFYLYAGINVSSGKNTFYELLPIDNSANIIHTTKSGDSEIQQYVGYIDKKTKDDSTEQFLGVQFYTSASLKAPDKWNTAFDNYTNILPLLKIVVDSNKVVTSISIPEESLVKFKTNDSYRSVTIDDGRLS